ncbi:hypothetical protein HPP92_003400 [Vanilla planifolia]|uniref:DYW domain-containing protein n=1 Tax=Vanilla planifolia TaxID=51239 RepID=A0A835SGL0_VANPL|nr:hypothetical protein HPP92_003400 [Vanilla planifolia]
MVANVTSNPFFFPEPYIGNRHQHRTRFSLPFRTPLVDTWLPATNILKYPPRSLQLRFSLPTHNPQYLQLLRLSSERRDITLGQTIHASITKSQYGGHTRLLNSLISTYLKLGFLSEALKVLEEMPFPDVVSFSSIISHCAKSGVEEKAVGLFNQMRHMLIDPNEYSFVAIVTSCIRQSNLQMGSQVHALAFKTNYSSFIYVANALMGMYVRCGEVGYALQVFGQMPIKDVSSWNAAILGMVEEVRYGEAFELFNDMNAFGLFGDQFSLSILLRAAAEDMAIVAGESIHAYALKIGLDLDLNVGNALLSFYTKFGKAENLLDVFNEMPVKDIISWTGMLYGFMEFGLVESAVEHFNKMPEKNHISYNTLLAGFCRNGHVLKIFDLFRQMLVDGAVISDFTISIVMKACSLLSDISVSKQIHGFTIKSGTELSAWINSSLVDMYAKCGRIKDACKIFEQRSSHKHYLAAWTSLIHAYAHKGHPIEALSLFQRMLNEVDLTCMDDFILATVLEVCGTLGFSFMGKQIKGIAVKLGVCSHIAVGNAIVCMYAKCGHLDDAVFFFNQMPQRDIISWNTLIRTYVLFRLGDRAIAVWNQMEECGVEPDAVSYILIISACKYTNVVSVDTCQRLFHSMSSSQMIEAGPEHYAAMVHVLGFWGCFDKAEKLIMDMPFKPDASVWRALLDSCRLHSDYLRGRQAAQRLFALEPQDPSTYILIANLYSASGRWQCSEKVRDEMRIKGLQKIPACSWVINQDVVHSFFCRDKSHPRYKDINGALEILIVECLKAGYVPDTSFVLHEVEEYQKRNFLFYHSAKLAAIYGILIAGDSQIVRVFKNVRLCGDCHVFLKFASALTRRDIIIRDSTGFHRIRLGECSCKDCW